MQRWTTQRSCSLALLFLWARLAWGSASAGYTVSVADDNCFKFRVEIYLADMKAEQQILSDANVEIVALADLRAQVRVNGVVTADSELPFVADAWNTLVVEQAKEELCLSLNSLPATCLPLMPWGPLALRHGGQRGLLLRNFQDLTGSVGGANVSSPRRSLQACQITEVNGEWAFMFEAKPITKKSASITIPGLLELVVQDDEKLNIHYDTTRNGGDTRTVRASSRMTQNEWSRYTIYKTMSGFAVCEGAQESSDAFGDGETMISGPFDASVFVSTADFEVRYFRDIGYANMIPCSNQAAVGTAPTTPECGASSSPSPGPGGLAPTPQASPSPAPADASPAPTPQASASPAPADAPPAPIPQASPSPTPADASPAPTSGAGPSPAPAEAPPAPTPLAGSSPAPDSVNPAPTPVAGPSPSPAEAPLAPSVAGPSPAPGVDDPVPAPSPGTAPAPASPAPDAAPAPVASPSSAPVGSSGPAPSPGSSPGQDSPANAPVPAASAPAPGSSTPPVSPSPTPTGAGPAPSLQNPSATPLGAGPAPSPQNPSSAPVGSGPAQAPTSQGVVPSPALALPSPAPITQEAGSPAGAGSPNPAPSHEDSVSPAQTTDLPRGAPAATATTLAKDAGAAATTTLHTVSTAAASATAKPPLAVTTVEVDTATGAASVTTAATTTADAATSSPTAAATTTATTTTVQALEFSNADDAVEAVSRQETAVLDELFRNPNASMVTQRLQGVTITAFGLQPPAPGGKVEVSLDAGGAALEMPASVFSSIGAEKASCVAGTYDNDVLASITGEPAGSSLAIGAVSISLFSETGSALTVKGLSEPILLTLPVNRSKDRTCAYWSEQGKQWQTDGVSEVPGPEGAPLVCATTHLSFFASVWRGFLNALLCSQLTLFNAESMAALFKGDWWSLPISIVFWVLLAILVLLFTAAYVLDSRRDQSDYELFLIPTRHLRSGSWEEVEEGEAPVATSRSPCNYCASCFASCKESNALRDAVDDVLSGWFEYFGEIRSLVESIISAFSMKDDDRATGSRCTRILKAIMGSLVMGAARRRASASLGLSDENVSFIMEDKDLGKILQEADSLRGRTGQELTKWETRIRDWDYMHRTVMAHFNSHWERTSWRALPGAFGQLFFASNPCVTVFLGCHFWSCGLRVLLFTAELLGAIVVATLFYEATGNVKSRRSRCDSDASGLAEQLGRVIAIGVVSLLFASLPIALLSSLHTRSFKKFDHESDPAWQRQLRAWRLQDRALWVIGMAYIAFCVFFILLFLANVAPEELPMWGLSGAISLLQDTLVIPFAVALVLPLLATSMLSITSCITGTRPQVLLEDRRDEMESLRGNGIPFQLTGSV